MKKFTFVVAVALAGTTALPGVAVAAPEYQKGTLCVLTNKSTPSNLEEVATRIIEAKRKNTGSGSDLEKMAKAATDEFGSGFFGHSWLVYTDNSGKPHTAGWRHGEGLVLDGPYEKPDRQHEKRRCLGISETRMKQVKSAVEAKMKGVQYSPVNNCTEFAGRVFVEATGDVVEFRQDVSPLLKDGSDPDRKLLATLAKQMLGEKTSVASPGQLGAGISRLQT